MAHHTKPLDRIARPGGFSRLEPDERHPRAERPRLQEQPARLDPIEFGVADRGARHAERSCELAHVQARRAEQTAHRLRGLTFLKARGRRNRRSVHAELSASPHPQGGESPPRQGRGDERITEEQARINAEGIALVRAALHEVAWLDEQRRPPRERG